MHRLVPALSAEMGAAYPELIRAQPLIEATLRQEETRFRQTLANGLKLLDEATASMGQGGTLPGDVAFKLHDTYGFPYDLTEDALEELLAVCTGAGAAGLIATNTTLARDGLAAADQWRATEPGGLSGAPLTRRAREVVAFLAARTALPIIGVGGIVTRDDGRAMLDAGARLLQVYTGYIYRGPALVSQLNRLGTRRTA